MSQSEFEGNGVFEAPQCLIYNDENTGELKVSARVTRQIAAIERHLNAIAIAGLYRTGKSYLMSRLAGKYQGFPLGSTVESKTKGIWVWCRPHPKDSNQVLLLLDTEGLGDVAKGDANHDNKLFALATLLSRTLIYNMLGVLNQDVLDKLNFITEISKNIKTSDASTDDSELDLYFPDLILALRDKTLQMIIGGKEVTPDEYFEHCLNLLPGEDENTKKKNKPRQCIRKYFKNRHCFTFERPGSSKKLIKLEELTDDDLDEDFVEDTKTFLDFVYDTCKPLTLRNGKVVNGSMFVCLLESYITSINEGAVPCIESAVRSMAIIQNQKGIEKAVQAYMDGMTKNLKLPVEDEKALFEIHQQCVADAVKIFLQCSILDENHEFQKKANNLILEELEGFQKANDEASEVECRKLLRELHEPIRQSINKNKYTVPGGFKKYHQDFEQLKEDYKKRSLKLGDKKNEVLLSFMNEMRSESEAILRSDEKVTATEKEKEHERQQKEAAEKREQVVKDECVKRENELKNLQKQTEENIRQLTEQQTKDIQEITKRNDEALTARLSEQKRLMEEGHSKLAQQTQNEIKRLQEEDKKKEAKFAETIHEMKQMAEEAKELSYNQIQEMKKEFEEKAKEANIKFDGLKKEYEAAQRAAQRRGRGGCIIL